MPQTLDTTDRRYVRAKGARRKADRLSRVSEPRRPRPLREIY